jgi:urease accessory protein
MPMIADDGLCRLMTWLSPSFPVGAYAYSHGLEYAVESGMVGDAGQLARWVAGILAFGGGRIDAGLFRWAWEAARDGDAGSLARAVERGEVMRGSAETALESMAQGRAFLDTVLRAWPQPRIYEWRDELAAAAREPAYPVAVGVCCAVAGIPLRPALTAYLHAFAANLVSAGVRLIPLGQTAGQQAMAALEQPVLDAVGDAIDRELEDLSAAALMADWTSMQHETQYTRLFRS